MNIKSNLSARLLCAVSLVALSTAAQAQNGSATETVTVTGSRVITDITTSPTPLTVVTTADLEATTPTDIPDALNKLPIFSGSQTTRSINNASTNSAENILNLRSFGASRTLVLQDGHRVTPSNDGSTVNADTMPSMLVQRVDIVTGGASAVYGSDAVTGVVNYILNKHYSGVRLDVSAGISGYGDAASQKVGLAIGGDVFGHGHFEMSLQHFHQDGLDMYSRPAGRQSWLQTGSGTAAAPFTSTEYALRTGYAYGGYITCGNTCAANGKQFLDGGLIGPWFPGTPTATNGISSGGDGVTTNISHITSALTTNQAFAHFNYNLDDTTTFYVQASANTSADGAIWQNSYIKQGNTANKFFVNNPYLPAASQALLASGNTSKTSATLPYQTFSDAQWFINQGKQGGFQTNGTDRNLSIAVGLDGQWRNYNWDVYYTHGQDRLKVDDPGNINNQKMYAAEDAVLNSSGQVVCYISTQPADIAAHDPGCVPMNPFGPNALTPEAYRYWTGDTYFITTNVLDDASGSISGDVFDDWAGPIKAALSGEVRWQSYGVESNATPTDLIDCTGLRLCSTSTTLWQGNTVNSSPTTSENVWEIAGELNVPLLKNFPLVQDLNTDIAGRYTDYSTSGPVQTWKIGINWQVSDDIRLRATNSIDIRAPTLDDLFSPSQISHASYSDILTKTASSTITASQGNPDLVPEVARTYTYGMVLTPEFIPGLNASVDYYDISLKNALGGIGGTSTSTQNLCIASNGVSPYCALYVRPIAWGQPGYNTAANYPTEVLSESLNTAYNEIAGWDFELDYNFELASIAESLPGAMTLRMLVNDQPVQASQSYPGGAINHAAGSKASVTSFVTYNLGSWRFNLEDRWIAGGPKSSLATTIYADPRLPSRNYDDLTVTKNMTFGDQTVAAYLSINNIFDVKPPIDPTNNSSPGLYFPSPGTYDVVGRAFTLGMRANL